MGVGENEWISPFMEMCAGAAVRRETGLAGVGNWPRVYLSGLTLSIYGCVRGDGGGVWVGWLASH